MPGIHRENLDSKVEALFDEIVAWRRYIHQHPELSYKENETAAYIEAELKKMDPEGKHLTVTRPIPNGLWADLKGTKGDSKKIILLRADIDALAVVEESDVDFKSKKHGLSHACGHDGHAAMLLGAAKLLLSEVDQIDGTVRFLFQPAEEIAPGGMKMMLEAGCDKGVTMAFAEHVLPMKDGPTGTVMMRSGVMFNSADNFTLKIIGKGGHASMPELSVDPVVTFGMAVTALQGMITRRLPSNSAPVLTISSIHSSTDSFNITADEVVTKGSLRCGNGDVRQKTKQYMEEVLSGITKSMGATYELVFEPGYAICVNHPDAFAVAERAAKQVLPNPEKEIFYMPNPMKASDDFAFLAEKVPSLYAGIGCYNEKLKCTAANHNTKFKVDEDCFKVGVKLHYGVIHELLMA